MKKIAILGSTGSIGQNALQVARHLRIKVTALAAHSNIYRLKEQAEEFQPKVIGVYDEKKARELQELLPEIEVIPGMEGVIAAATESSAEMVISAMVGAAGILPTLRAIEAKKAIGLANKEVLIAAGELIMKAAQKQMVPIIPIDSEHSAIFQCLRGEDPKSVKRIILTASGGPFRDLPQEEFEKITPSAALKHPTWAMGNKITIDSSTMMNKGLEVIEAHYLFNVPLRKIDVVIHPQSIVHSLVEFVDGSLLAQMASHDMRIPIQYALTYPRRKKGIASCFDFRKYSKLEFFTPRWDDFPCLRLAFEAAETGGTLPCFMNAANEILVRRFLSREISWLEIGKKLETLMGAHEAAAQKSFDTLFEVDKEAREMARTL